MERLTDPAQGYCEMYCKERGHYNVMGFMVTIQSEIRECVRPFLTQILQGDDFLHEPGGA